MLEQKIDELMHKRTTEAFVKSTERDFEYLSGMVLCDIISNAQESLLQADAKGIKGIVKEEVERFFAKYKIQKPYTKECMVREILSTLESQRQLIAMSRPETAIFKSVGRYTDDRENMFENGGAILKDVINKYDDDIRLRTYFMSHDSVDHILEWGKDSDMYYSAVSVLSSEHIFSWTIMPLIDAELDKLAIMKARSIQEYRKYRSKCEAKVSRELENIVDSIMVDFTRFFEGIMEKEAEDDRTVFDA